MTFAEMARRLKHHPWYRDSRHLDAAGGLGLGRMALGFDEDDADEQPATNEDGSLRAVMVGEVYDREELRRALAAAGHVFRGNGTAELLVHGYEGEGRAFFQRLNGAFAAAIWDARAGRLIVANDRFGIKPLYYANPPGKLLLASEIKAILADADVSGAADLRGIAQFFTFGHLLNEDTFLEAVRILPAAAWLTYDVAEDRLTVGRYWRPEAGREALRIGEPEALDRLDEAFRRAVDRRVAGPGRLGLSLSGGLDSRTILAAINPERGPVAQVCLGVPGSIDLRAARRLAGLAGQPYHPCVLGEDFLGEFEGHLRRMVHLTDGHYLDQLVVMPTLPRYRELGVEVLLRGHAGELMHMDKAYNYSVDREAFALRGAADLEDWLLRRLRTNLSEPAEGPLFAPTHRARMDELARESLRAALRESDGVEPPVHRIWHLFLGQRIRRETALSMHKFGSVVETRLPYLDNDLIDLLLSLPPKWELSDRIQAHILRRRMPALLGVVNSNTGARIGAGPAGRLLGRARLKVLQKLRVRGYRHYERLGGWLRGELRPLVTRLLLDGRLLDRGLFDRQTITAAVRNHFDGTGNHTYLLLALMIFELGQREFLDGDPDALEVREALPRPG